MNLQITYYQGGMNEFERIGTYPRKIFVYDQILNKRWWRNITEEKNSGELKLRNRIIYKYTINLDLDEVSIFSHEGTLIKDYSIILEIRD
jgi:hypothetical protein